MSRTLTLSDVELRELTAYRQPAAQLRWLLAHGFYRASRATSGRVILERAHYEAVSAGRATMESPAPKLRPPRLRTA